MKSRMLLFVMAILFIGIARSVDAAVLCSNASGSVFVRAQCSSLVYVCIYLCMYIYMCVCLGALFT